MGYPIWKNQVTQNKKEQKNKLNYILLKTRFLGVCLLIEGRTCG